MHTADSDEKKVEVTTRTSESIPSSGDLGTVVATEAFWEELGVNEKKLVKKLDWWLIPQVMLLYAFSFLDRVNIGNARLYHLEKDLGLVGNQYQTAVSILFVSYLSCILPSNLIIKKVSPSRWITFITVSWGIIATMSGLVQNYGQLLACRLLLGAVEAGLIPGLILNLSHFYKREELAFRVACLFTSAAIAGGMGGLLAYGIGHMEGTAGMNGWRWILIIEGIPPVILGIGASFLFPNDAETAFFLTENERKALVARNRSQYGMTESAEQLSFKDVRAAFKDWKIFWFAAAAFSGGAGLYGFSSFLPTIIKGLGHWSVAEVQLLTVPCYFMGAVVYLTSAYYSDRLRIRGPFVVGGVSIASVGYSLLLSNTSSGVHYFGCFVVSIGMFTLVGLPLAWLPNNCPRYGKRTTAVALQITLGNCAGVMAPFIYPTADGPRYRMGHATTLALICLGGMLYGLMSFYLRRENRKREEGKVRRGYENMSEDELAELGDDSPHFRYVW